MSHPLTAAALLLALLAPARDEAADPYRGRLLYDTYCVPCHYADVHRRPRPRVHGLEELAGQIRTWQEVVRLGWSRQDIADVQAYLNWLYYRFPYYGGLFQP
jgi:hypothetical protein